MRAQIADLERRREEMDGAVARRDWAQDAVDANAAAMRGADVRFRQRNAGAAMNPVGAWGLHGAAGMDEPSQWGGQQQAVRGAMTVPMPPVRPDGLAGTVPQQLKDLKDVLGPGGDAINPTIVPKVDTSQIEGVKPKADEAKGAVEAVGAVTAKPTIDTASIEAATAAAQVLLSVLGSIPGAAGTAVAAATRAGAAAGTLRGHTSGSFSDGVTPGAGAE